MNFLFPINFLPLPLLIIPAEKNLLVWILLLLIPAFILNHRLRKYFNILVGMFLVAYLWSIEYLAFLVVGNVLLYYSVYLTSKYGGVAAKSTAKVLLLLGVTVLYFFLLHDPKGFKFISIPDLHWAGIAYLYPKTTAFIINALGRKEYVPAFKDYVHGVFFFPSFQQGPIDETQCYEDFSSPLYRRALYFAALAAIKLTVFYYVSDLKVFNLVDGLGFSTMSKFWLEAYRVTISGYMAFSSYSDTAVSLAAIQGIKLTDNFNNPYAATGPAEFWRRYHISLSRWFKNYIYIPLGGNRRHVYLNILITFAFVGLWHGTEWNYLLWGLWHAAGVIIDKFIRSLFPNKEGYKAKTGFIQPFVRLFNWFVTLNFVAAGWVLMFHPAKDAIGILRVMFGLFTKG